MIVNVAMCTDACVLVRGHVFVGVLIKPRSAVVGKMKSRLDLIMQCVGSLCSWIFSSTGCWVLLCSLLDLGIWISLLSNMLDLCVYNPF